MNELTTSETFSHCYISALLSPILHSTDLPFAPQQETNQTHRVRSSSWCVPRENQQHFEVCIQSLGNQALPQDVKFKLLLTVHPVLTP